MKRLLSLTALAVVLAASSAQAQQLNVKIGVMSDMSSLYADIGGPGSTAAAKLAIARILRTGARLLLLDEPTEGLAPVIIQQIGKTIRTLKQQGLTILLVEQNFRFASTVADRYYVMENGRVVEGFASADLNANLDKLHDYLGV